jgi:hypothetical protein
VNRFYDEYRHLYVFCPIKIFLIDTEQYHNQYFELKNAKNPVKISTKNQVKRYGRNAATD